MKDQYILKMNDNGEFKEFTLNVEENNPDEAVFKALEQAKLWMDMQWYQREIKIHKNDFTKQIEELEETCFAVLSDHKEFNQKVTLSKIKNEKEVA